MSEQVISLRSLQSRDLLAYFAVILWLKLTTDIRSVDKRFISQENTNQNIMEFKNMCCRDPHNEKV